MSCTNCQRDERAQSAPAAGGGSGVLSAARSAANTAPAASVSSQAGFLQARELALDCADVAPRHADQLGAPEPAVRLTEEEAQDSLLNRREQGPSQADAGVVPTHFGKDQTQFG